MLSSEQARDALALIDTHHLIVGHSHVQFLWAHEIEFVTGEVDESGASDWFALGGGSLVLNPGSVGQPRDRDPRAAYLLIDPEIGSVQFRRAPYNRKATQRAIRAIVARR